MLIVYSTGLSRLMGLPTSRIGDSNARTIEMADEIRNVVSDIPVIGGIEAWDPMRLDLDRLLDKFWVAGYSGVINYPQDDRFFFICDHEFLKKRGMGQLLPWPWTFSTKSYERAGYIQVADTLAGLASKIGLDAKALEATVAEHNEHAKTGVDPYFKRGESAFNKTFGDPSVGKANPNLGPIKTGPFVALRIVPATLGTATGLATDSSSRVLDVQGKPIDGLFACGNDATSVMRGIYPGAGITIGPGIVFAYRAVKAIREKQA